MIFVSNIVEEISSIRRARLEREKLTSMIWILLSLGSAILLGFYDIAKKLSVRQNAVPVVLLANVSVGAAIRSSSGLPAEILGLTDRGVLASGTRADLVILDSATRRVAATTSTPRMDFCPCSRRPSSRRR